MKVLKEHFSQQQQQTSENVSNIFVHCLHYLSEMGKVAVTITLLCLQDNDAATEDAHAAVDEQGARNAAFVTARRGKGRTAKRKISDSTPVTAQVFLSICRLQFYFQSGRFHLLLLAISTSWVL